MVWFTFMFALLFMNGLDSFTGTTHEEMYLECTNRFEHLKLKMPFDNCAAFIKKFPLCRQNISVAYAIHPPYIYQKDDGSVAGILTTMLKFALQSCCFGCNQVSFIGPFDAEDKFYQNSSLVLPIQTSKSTNKYSGHDYIYMFEVKAMCFIGPEPEHDPDKMIYIILQAVWSTWPLFVTAIFMAITAGVTIWVLDHPLNQNEFPQSFPRGPFEGFWWAVVSMTTVGYGDRSPRSICARLFAMIWILIGITIFSMYSATLTSALTSAAIASHDIPLYTKTFAILNTTSLGTMATMKENTHHKGYSSVEEMRKALQRKEVDGLVLEDNVANYYLKHMSEKERKELQLYKRIAMSSSSYGMLSYNRNLTVLLNSFFNSNDDQRDIMAKYGIGEHASKSFLLQRRSSSNAIFESTEMLTATLISLTVAASCLTLIGMFLRRRKTRKHKCKKDEELVSVNVAS